LPFIARRRLPAPLQKLKPYELENVLCIYAEQLARIMHGAAVA
jgi:hypothetical protein